MSYRVKFRLVFVGAALLCGYVGAADTDNDSLPDDWELVIIIGCHSDHLRCVEDVHPQGDYDGVEHRQGH